MRTIIASGELGDIVMVRARQAHNWGGRKPFTWSTEKNKSGGGTIADNASHYLDLLEFLIGKIKKLHALGNNLSFHGPVEDNAIISLQFQNRALGIIESSWGDASGRNTSITIWGTKAVLTLQQTNHEQALTITRYKQEQGLWNKAIAQSLYIPQGIEQRVTQKKIYTTMPRTQEATYYLLKHFLKLIHQKKRTRKPTLQYDPVRSVVLTQAAYTSLATGKTLQI